jgi:osmotically-inducible protein OsmY
MDPGRRRRRDRVAVEDGAVSLSGRVDSYIERVAAVRAALRVRGVSTLVDDLEVRRPVGGAVTDASIAEAMEHGLSWSTEVPATVQATVRDGVVTLRGEVDWDHQRAAARRIAEHVGGVREISNRITLSLRASAEETASSIRRALRRNALLVGTDIRVAVTGTRVALTGAVRTELARRQAISAAWGSPNVTAVEDRLTVTSDD